VPEGRGGLNLRSSIQCRLFTTPRALPSTSAKPVREFYVWGAFAEPSPHRMDWDYQ